MGIQNAIDLILALIYAPGSLEEEGEKIKGLTRLQKLIFLLWKEGDFEEYVPELKDFVAYNYGPFSSGLYDDLEFAESIKLLSVKKSLPDYKLENVDEVEAYIEALDIAELDLSNLKTREDFELTNKGIEVAKEIWNEIGDEERKNLQRIKTIYNQMPFMQLIRYVYANYPDYTKKSLLMI